MLAFLFGLATVLATLLGGLFAIKKKDELHLILGFSAGAVIGVAFFDLLPEALELTQTVYQSSLITTIIAIGFLGFMLLSRLIMLHPHSDGEHTAGYLGAGSFAIHSFLDGVGLGLAFQVSAGVGYIVAAAVLAHDFSDGINTVGMILNHKGEPQHAFRWLLLDAVAPLVGVASTRFYSLSSTHLGLLLSLFCGFFIYLGASDLLPESQHHHPKLITSIMTILGAGVIFVIIRLAE